MDTCLADASPMDKWFPLTANMATSWLEIAAFVVLMEDGILLSRNVKVSNSSTSQEKFFTNILWLINWEQHILTIWEGLSKKYRNSVYFYFGSIYLFYICCHYVYCKDREIHRNQYRRILSIQLGHLELFLSSCTHVQSSFIHVIRSFNFCPIATLTNTLPKIKGPHSKKHSNIKHVYI